MNKISIASMLFLIALVALIAPKQTLAQGTHSCRRVTVYAGCVPSNISCEAGYVVDLNYCKELFGLECENAPERNCIRESTPLDFSSLESVSVPKFAGGSIGNIVSELLKYLFPFAGLLLLLYLLFGGFSLMTSGGDPKAVQSAKGKITNALIGFIIVFAAYWIVQIIGTILGIEAITEIFG